MSAEWSEENDKRLNSGDYDDRDEFIEQFKEAMKGDEV